MKARRPVVILGLGGDGSDKRRVQRQKRQFIPTYCASSIIVAFSISYFSNGSETRHSIVFDRILRKTHYTSAADSRRAFLECRQFIVNGYFHFVVSRNVAQSIEIRVIGNTFCGFAWALKYNRRRFQKRP